MTERIDHAAEARRILVDGESAVAKARAAQHESKFQTADAYGKKAAGCWGQAQVHATLALVEQQRIANLIALGTARIAPDQPPPLRSLVFELEGQYDIRPTLPIREALS